MEIRDATEGDVDFLAWVMLAASRSQLDRGIWEYLYDWDEETTLEWLRRMATTDAVHFFHHSLYVVAEVDGTPAAGMCLYDQPTQGVPAAFSHMVELAAQLGVDPDDAECARRGAVLMAGMPPSPAPQAAVVENVATRAEFRRQGVVHALLTELFDRGRERGYDTAEISVLIGNEAARRAYIKAGFEAAAEARDPRWDAEVGCPGSETLLRPLD